MEYLVAVLWTIAVGLTFYAIGFNDAYNRIFTVLDAVRNDKDKNKLNRVLDTFIANVDK